MASDRGSITGYSRMARAIAWTVLDETDRHEAASRVEHAHLAGAEGTVSPILHDSVAIRTAAKAEHHNV
jgi:hypothetical protein